MEFLDKDVVLAIHDRQLAEHGGLGGIRDEALLDSALARPQNRHAYDAEVLVALAASYAFGIARNHPFLDGNNRTAWAVARTFMAMNGLRLIPSRAQAVENMVLLAEGLLDEAGFAAWLGSQPRR
ncbi:MAG: type II toxin-antitoxin system death-on-curing family toxin [Nevskia sp.]|nr:type II toxin-antitoxin system death-on-curing family toxin [Nevskia sp.]